MNFRVFVNCDNAAFDDVTGFNGRGEETARILREIADRISRTEELPDYITLRDINGNDVGRATFSED